MFQTASRFSMSLGHCWCQPASSLVSLLNLLCLLLCCVVLWDTLVCCFLCYDLLLFLDTVILHLVRVTVLWGAEPFIPWSELSCLWRSLLACRAGMWCLPSSWDLMQGQHFFSVCSGGTPMPGLGHKPHYSLGVPLVTVHAPAMLLSAAASLAANLILMSSLLCFWHPNSPPRPENLTSAHLHD